MRRVVILLLDGVGVGELPDAGRYGDAGSNSLRNLAEAVGGLDLPNLQRLGLGNVLPLRGCARAEHPAGSFGKMAEASAGKDSTAGHWEIAGVVTREVAPVFPDGFPQELVKAFEDRIGTKTIGNLAISGTEAIRLYGEEHLRTGYPIIYTSADSVFQIAAHEDKWPVDEVYRLCRVAREMLKGKWAVSRVIARPFIGSPGHFQRTPRRKDFSLEPPGPTLLDVTKEAGLEVSLVGKLDDLFAQRGFTRSWHSVNNLDCLEQTCRELEREFPGVLFTNLIQFDMDWGHRNDVAAYYNGLREFDQRLPEVLARLKQDDLLFITADHGNDPTTASTDHSREYVPLLVSGKSAKPGIDLGIRSTFADLGQTAAEYLGIRRLENGTSFLKEIAV